VHIGGWRVLVPGDIEARGERTLLASGVNLHADVLVLPHHGSRTSSTLAFIEAVSPGIAVVSAGRDNQFGHPHPEVVARYSSAGAHVLSTADLGTITLELGEQGVEARGSR
jgi:competence protein ComEC